MPGADAIAALFEQLRREDVDAMPPARRERFAQLCEHWANFARLRPDTTKGSVVIELRRGQRGE
jgi:hypothetical protein